MVVRRLWFVAVVVTAACSSKNVAGDAGADRAANDCPVSYEVSALPTGACMGLGGCVLRLVPECRPGVNAIPVTPPVYTCDCESGNWRCELLSGGLGLRLCSDGGGGN